MNNINNNNEIIVAMATPYGKSAVAIIRISGNGCIDLVDGFLSRPLKVGKLEYNSFTSGSFTEKLMAVCFKSPKSYTGEDIVELFPHGNPTVCDIIIKELIFAGARAAEKGEFTKRAFLNGKVDLMQCEALADIIDAQTPEQLSYGNKRYDGGFKGLNEVEKALKAALGTVEAILHYSDELEGGEQDEALLRDVYGALDKIVETLEKEEHGFAGGRIINDGFKIALFGFPNVGKSTLINALTESERAIVTPIAGTTRDTVDGYYSYNGRKFSVTDTAGYRSDIDVTDQVEKIGINRALKAANDSDLILLMTDDGGVLPNIRFENKKTLTVANKCDSDIDVGIDHDKAYINGVFRISAKHGINIAALKQKLYELCPKDFGGICNHRQYNCVKNCLEYCRAAKKAVDGGESLELAAALLFDAYSAIQELYGEKADEKIIDSVFERFCVGK